MRMEKTNPVAMREKWRLMFAERIYLPSSQKKDEIQEDPVSWMILLPLADRF